MLKVADTKGYAHLSVAAVISEKGHLYYQVRESSFNGRAICRLLDKLHKKWKWTSHTLIWDGASIHTSKEVKAFLSQPGFDKRPIELQKLPPYSPELNPVELVWSYLKGTLLKNIACKNLKELKILVCDALESIKKDKKLIKAFFKHPEVAFYA